MNKHLEAWLRESGKVVNAVVSAAESSAVKNLVEEIEKDVPVLRNPIEEVKTALSHAVDTISELRVLVDALHTRVTDLEKAAPNA